MTDKPPVPRTPTMTTAERDAALVGTPYDPAWKEGLHGSAFGRDMNGNPLPKQDETQLPTEDVA